MLLQPGGIPELRGLDRDLPLLFISSYYLGVSPPEEIQRVAQSTGRDSMSLFRDGFCHTLSVFLSFYICVFVSNSRPQL